MIFVTKNTINMTMPFIFKLISNPSRELLNSTLLTQKTLNLTPLQHTNAQMPFSHTSHQIYD